MHCSSDIHDNVRYVFTHYFFSAGDPDRGHYCCYRSACVYYFIEKQAKEAGRKFLGSLTKIPSIDWNKEIEDLKVSDEIKEQVKIKLEQSLRRMKAEK